MGEAAYFTAVQYLCLDKRSLVQDEVVLNNITNFQVLVKVLEQPEVKDKKKDVLTLLTLMFPSYQPIITGNSIILNAEEDNILIDDSNFIIFQEVLKEVLCVNSLFQQDNIIYNPVNKKAKEIADKIMKGRAKAAALNAEKNTGSVLGRYMSILAIGGSSYTLKDCGDLNIFQLFDQIERYTAKLEWEIDLKVRLAGGKPDKEVESWMRELHSKQ